MKRPGDGDRCEYETEESFLVYRVGELQAYQAQVTQAMLPYGPFSLQEHYAHLTAFLDDLYDVLLPRLAETIKLTPLLQQQPQEEPVVATTTTEMEAEPNFDILVSYFNDDDAAAGSAETPTVSPQQSPRRELSPEPRREAHPYRLKLLCKTVWDWHREQVRREHRGTAMYAVCHFFSWLSFCRIFYLAVCDDEALNSDNERRCQRYLQYGAPQFTYSQQLDGLYNVILSAEPLMLYSVSELLNSVRLILPTLYSHRYSVEQKDYVHALFFRYCDLLCMQQSPEQLQSLLDNPLFLCQSEQQQQQQDRPVIIETDTVNSAVERFYDQFQDRAIPLTPDEDYSLKTPLVYEGEILFFYQIYRLNLSTQLQALCEDETLRWVDAEPVSELHALRVCCEMICVLARDERLRQEILGEYKTYLPHMYLYHGDRERYRRHFPKSNTAPTAILNNFRPQQMLAIQKITREYTIQDTIQRYEEACKKRLLKNTQQRRQLSFDVESEQDDPLAQVEHELEFCFLLRSVTQIWFTFQQVPDRQALQECFVLEEMPHLTDRNQKPQLYQTRVKQQYTSSTTLDTISNLLHQFELQRQKLTRTKKPLLPRLIRLQRLYYVVDMERCQLLCTNNLVEAYVQWIRLLLRQRVLCERTLHPLLQSVV
jgi:hypothetical protein